MAVLPILRWPDARLSEVCAPVSEIDLGLIADMFETMYAAPGRGLAAPQVGVMQRLFVMDAGWKEGEMTPLACIDPEIVAASDDRVSGPEACLSIPGIEAAVTRHGEITLRYRDVNGAGCETRLSGAAAVIAQHELDHLDGRVIFDRLPEAEAARLRAAYA